MRGSALEQGICRQSSLVGEHRGYRQQERELGGRGSDPGQ